MLVKVFRAREEEKVEIDTKLIYEDSVEWTKNRGLNGAYIPLPYYVLKCQIAYPTAVEFGLASGMHESKYNINRANIFLYKKDNEKDPRYKDGYKYLCALAGPKPKY